MNIFDTNVDFILTRMLMLSHLYMKVNDWIFDTNVNVSYKC